MEKLTKSATEYIFKVCLKRRRSIWRTVALRGDHTLDDLHEIIFAAFDRDDEHLYSFYLPKAPSRQALLRPRCKEYTAPSGFGSGRDPGIENAARVTLDALTLRAGQTFEYVFDFGDESWHVIKVETIGPTQSGESFPRILQKKGASPQQYA